MEQGLGKRREGAGNSARLFVFVCFSELRLLKKGTGTGEMEMSMRQTPSAHFTNPFSQKKKKEANGQMAQMVSASGFTNDCCSSAAAKYARRRNMHGVLRALACVSCAALASIRQTC